jgi:hypothetical protein
MPAAVCEKPGDQTARATNRQRREGTGRAEKYTQEEMDMASVPQLVRLHIIAERFSTTWGIIKTAQCLDLLYAS